MLKVSKAIGVHFIKAFIQEVFLLRFLTHPLIWNLKIKRNVLKKKSTLETTKCGAIDKLSPSAGKLLVS